MDPPGPPNPKVEKRATQKRKWVGKPNNSPPPQRNTRTDRRTNKRQCSTSCHSPTPSQHHSTATGNRYPGTNARPLATVTPATHAHDTALLYSHNQEASLVHRSVHSLAHQHNGRDTMARVLQLTSFSPTLAAARPIHPSQLLQSFPRGGYG